MYTVCKKIKIEKREIERIKEKENKGSTVNA